jgi:uncharacterized membrane protein YfcA
MILFLLGEVILFLVIGIVIWEKRKSIDVVSAYILLAAAIAGAFMGLGFALKHEESILQFLRAL